MLTYLPFHSLLVYSLICLSQNYHHILMYFKPPFWTSYHFLLFLLFCYLLIYLFTYLLISFPNRTTWCLQRSKCILWKTIRIFKFSHTRHLLIHFSWTFWGSLTYACDFQFFLSVTALRLYGCLSIKICLRITSNSMTCLLKSKVIWQNIPSTFLYTGIQQMGYPGETQMEICSILL